MVCTVSFMMCCVCHNGCIPLGSGSVIWDHLDHVDQRNLWILSQIGFVRSYDEVLLGLIPTINMALKQWHRTAEMTTNDTKMGWNCDSDRERHKHNNCKIPTATWLPPQYTKPHVLKFRLRDIRNPPRGAFLMHHDLSDLILIQVISTEHTQGFFSHFFSSPFHYFNTDIFFSVMGACFYFLLVVAHGWVAHSCQNHGSTIQSRGWLPNTPDTQPLSRKSSC